MAGDGARHPVQGEVPESSSCRTCRPVDGGAVVVIIIITGGIEVESKSRQSPHDKTLQVGQTQVAEQHRFVQTADRVCCNRAQTPRMRRCWASS